MARIIRTLGPALSFGLTFAGSVAAEPGDDPPRTPDLAHAVPRGVRHWSAEAAERLVERARLHEARQQSERALVAYTEALQMDTTYAPAWLGLGRLRARRGDLAEADRVLSQAARLPEIAADALTERARVRRRLGQLADAQHDLESALTIEPTLERARELSSWYVERRAWLPALQLWRRLDAELEQRGASDDRDEARLHIRALMVLADDTDPVASGAEASDWVRRSLARIAHRAHGR